MIKNLIKVLTFEEIKIIIQEVVAEKKSIEQERNKKIRSDILRARCDRDKV